MQIGRVSFSGIKGYDHSLTFCIYPNVAHSRDAHERFAQFADAFIAIFAFRRDRDSLQHRFVWTVRIVRVGWIEMLGIEWLDHSVNLPVGTRRASVRLKVARAAKPAPQSRFVWREHFLVIPSAVEESLIFCRRTVRDVSVRAGAYSLDMTKEADRLRGSSRCRLFGRSRPRDRFEYAPDIAALSS